MNPFKMTLNPLDIPEVVRIITDNIGKVEDLKTARSLSRLWRDESLGKWRSTAVLVLTEEVIAALVNAYLSKGGNGAVNSDQEANPPTDKFFRLFDNDGKFHFWNFRYPHKSSGINKIYPPPPDATEPTRILWEQFFSKAKFLDLGTCVVRTTGNSLGGIKWILKSCPELKRLDFSPYHYNEHRERLMLPEFHDLDEDEQTPSVLETLSIGRSLNYNYYYKWHIFNTLDNVVNRGRFEKLLQFCPNLKNLWIHDEGHLLNAIAQENHKLENLALVYSFDSGVNLPLLKTYVENSGASFKSLVLSLSHWRDCLPRPNERKDLAEILDRSKDTLDRLELYVDCDREKWEILKRPLDLTNGGKTIFSNLTILRLCWEYQSYHEKLINFDFESLRGMKKLKEFRFETGVNVAKDWVRRKLGVEDIQKKKKKQEELVLPELKHFHFHSNFTSGALELLGRVAPGLKSLKVVFDEESFLTGMSTWPELKRITLLPCSRIPKRLITEAKAFKPEMKIVNRSKGYEPALGSANHREHVINIKYKGETNRKFCKQTKPF